MKIIKLFIIICLLTGCPTEKAFKGMPSTENPPFILVAKTINKDSTKKAAIIMDANGVYYNLVPGMTAAHSIYDSYEVGDTIL